MAITAFINNYNIIIIIIIIIMQVWIFPIPLFMRLYLCVCHIVPYLIIQLIFNYIIVMCIHTQIA